MNTNNHKIKRNRDIIFCFTVVFMYLPACKQRGRQLSKLLTIPMKQVPKPLQLCYISLNNDKEFGMARTLIDDIQASLGLSKVITVKELHNLREDPAKNQQSAPPSKYFQKRDPKESIAKALSDQTVCDGLVISGHHTGSFGGQLASGELNIDFLAKHSCAKSSAPFFS